MTAHGTPSVPFGAAMRKAHFAFAPHYTPLNHGSYGVAPVPVRRAHEALRAEAEGAADPFIALELHGRLAAQRALAANALNCPDVDDLVFVPNATTASDTVLKNIDWQAGDAVLCYEVVYDALRSGLLWLEEKYGVSIHVVKLAWPIPDDDLVEAMVGAARAINAETRPRRRRVRLAIVDTVVSLPGVRVPFERLVPALQAEGALVLVDGAHGVGHVDIDLAALRPDFFLTNLHKWLFVPRGCAAFYVARGRQGLVRSTLPTSFYFAPKGGKSGGEWAEMFDFTGTNDTTNWLCVEAALDFRTNVCGGDAAIKAYCYSVAQASGAAAAKILGTEVMDVAGSCLRDCCFANVRLPLEVGAGKIEPENAGKVTGWLKATGYRESGMYFQTILYRGAWWWRISGMIYVEVEDFERGAEVLRDLCVRAQKGEFLEAA